MATHKVGVYRRYLGAVPLNEDGTPIPESKWPKRRRFCWIARWVASDGSRRSRSFKTKSEARSFAHAQEVRIQQVSVLDLPAITLRGYYLEHQRLMRGSVARRTLVSHLSALEMLAEELGWDRHLHTIGPVQIEQFRAGRLRGGIEAVTANKDLKILKRLFNLAILRGYLPKDSNPCNGLPKLKVGSMRITVVRGDIFAKIYAQSPDAFWRALTTTFYTSGLRLREAINLTWDDIDFENRHLYVTRKKAGDFVQAWTPKDHQLRMIPLPGQTTALLEAWRRVAPQGCPYIFIEQPRWDYIRQRIGEGLWQEDQDLVNNLLRRFQTICRRAGVDEYSLHDLRRSCITNWASRLPIHVVQHLAGHSDIRTTQRYYLVVQAEDLQRAREIQEALLGPVPKAHLADPNLTHSLRKRVFPGTQGCPAKRQALA